MWRILVLLAAFCAGGLGLWAEEPFTVRQILSAPFASELVASPVGHEFAWVENAEGVRNVWVGGPGETARMVTAYTADDGQEIRGLVWSPYGDAVAYTYGAEEGVDGKVANPAHLQRELALEVVVLDVKSGKSVDLGAGHSPMFTRDEEAVVFIRAGQLWMSALVEGAAKRLVFDRGIASGVTISPDGKLLAFVSTRDEGKASEHSFIGLVGIPGKTLRFVAPSTGVDTAPAFSRDGKQIAWLRGPFGKVKEFAVNRVSDAPWSVMVADVADPSKARAVFTAEAGKVGSVLPHMSTGEPKVWWLADGRVVFASEMESVAPFIRRKGAWLHLYSVDATKPGSKAALLTPAEGEVEDAVVSPDSHTLMWASNQVGNALGVIDITGPSESVDERMALFDADDDRRHLRSLNLAKANELPDEITRGAGIETNPAIAGDGTVAALVSDVRRPMHVALIRRNSVLNTDTGVDDGIVALNNSVPVEFPQTRLVTPSKVLIEEVNGPQLHGQLFLPRREADPSAAPQDDKSKGVDGGLRANAGLKHAAIIFVHGGPNRQMLLGYPAMEYYSNAYAMNQYLASRGFVVLSVNYRSGIGYGLTFRQCEGCGVNGAAEYADVLAAVKYLRSRPDVDAKRIGIWAGSYGGYLTAMALARNSDMFAAGVDFSGVHDWNLEDNVGDWKQGSNAEKDAIGAKALASSPMGDLSKWRSPVLLIHGDDDPDVAYQQTPVLAEALRARKVPVEEMVFPDEVHDFLLHETWVKAYEKAAEFFVRVLRP